MSEHRAIVIGATGAVGSNLVRELLSSPRYASVITVGRRTVETLASGEGAARLSQRIVDMDHLERDVLAAAAGCDTAFCTMGVGQPSKVSPEELQRVDVDYASAFARACKTAGVQHISLLSSTEASAKSRSRYLRVKAAAEEALTSLGFARVSLFRPSVLVTPDIRYGFQDRVTQLLTPMVTWALPKRFHQVRVEDLARAMRLNAERPATAPVEILHYPEFQALLKG